MSQLPFDERRFIYIEEENKAGYVISNFKLNRHFRLMNNIKEQVFMTDDFYVFHYTPSLIRKKEGMRFDIKKSKYSEDFILNLCSVMEYSIDMFDEAIYQLRSRMILSRPFILKSPQQERQVFEIYYNDKYMVFSVTSNVPFNKQPDENSYLYFDLIVSGKDNIRENMDTRDVFDRIYDLIKNYL